jgi:hypothetical protein
MDSARGRLLLPQTSFMQKSLREEHENTNRQARNGPSCCDHGAQELPQQKVTARFYQRAAHL